MVRLLALTFLLGLFQSTPLSASLLKHRSTSNTGAFIVYGQDVGWRNRTTREAEKALALWNRTIDAPVRSTAPVVIQDRTADIRPKGMPGMQITVFEVEGGGTRVQLDVWEKGAGSAMALEIFRALCLYAIHQSKPPKPGSALATPPEWLVEALAESLRGRDGEVPSGVHAALLRSDRPPSLAGFLKGRPSIMDSPSLVLYRAQAHALLDVLRNTPESKRWFAEFLVGNPAPTSVEGLLKAFPVFPGGEQELTRRWTLSIARTSMPQTHSSLGVQASNEALEGLLSISVPADPKNPEAGELRGPAALPAAARTRDGSRLMRERALECVGLEFRAHPLMKSIISEYRRIFMTLERKPKAKVQSEIEELERLRALVVERHGQILDYLNWYEATQLDANDDSPFEGMSGFPGIQPRTDPLTRYLDGFEALGW